MVDRLKIWWGAGNSGPAPMLVPKRPAGPPLLITPNRRRGRTVGTGKKRTIYKIEMIILHATVGGWTGSVDWLRNPKAKASCHYIIDRNGDVLRLAPDEDTTWHAGLSRWDGRRRVNERSIGIELVNKNNGKDPYPKAQLEACLWVCRTAAIAYRIGPDRIIGHKDVAPGRKTDPAGFPWAEFRAAFAAALKKPEEEKP